MSEASLAAEGRGTLQSVLVETGITHNLYAADVERLVRVTADQRTAQHGGQTVSCVEKSLSKKDKLPPLPPSLHLSDSFSFVFLFIELRLSSLWLASHDCLSFN